MVNYCVVYGCGRNSKSNENLSFYSLPKEKHRTIEWLKAAGREDLVNKVHNNKLSVTSQSKRFCSRHFSPTDIVNRSKHLARDVVPTLNLPGQWLEEKSDDEHMDVVCDSCQKAVHGFRYKCVTCEDYDLCRTCESLGAHPQHFVLRIPRPVKFKLVDNLIKKWRKFFKEEHATPKDLIEGTAADDSSDDEPITKYAKNYDSGVDLTEDVKEKIRKEIKRVVNLKLDHRKKTKKAATLNKKGEKKRQAPQEVIERERVIIPSKRLKEEKRDKAIDFVASNNAPEVVFADVNDIKEHQVVDLKPEGMEYSSVMPAPATPATSRICETAPLTPAPTATSLPILSSSAVVEEPSPSSSEQLHHLEPSTQQESTATFPEVPILQGDNMQQPVMHVKLSDDLTELMIEVTSNNQRTVYKYSDL